MKLWSNGTVAKDNGGFNPERRLLTAVLQRAITDYLTCDGEVQESARQWLYESDDTRDEFGFSYICEALDFHKDELRKAVRCQFETQKSSPVPGKAVGKLTGKIAGKVAAKPSPRMAA